MTVTGLSQVSQDDTDNEGVYDNTVDPAWTSATFTAYYALWYDATLVGDDLIASFDFGGAKSVTGGTFTLQLASEGVINLN